MIDSRSIYSWKGKLEEATEVISLVKIRSEDFDKVRDFVLSKHPYDVPCIVRYEIVEGDKAYLDWIRDSTEIHPADSDQK